MRQTLTLLTVVLFMSAQPAPQKKLDQLLVYGENFVFGVKEPPGWTGDTSNAEEFQANLVLHENGQPLTSFSGLIRIHVDNKVDENTSADLAADMRDYRSQYPKVQFRDLPVSNPNYRCFAKLFYMPGEFYEYVTYVNPGRQEPILISVSMNTQKSEATPQELQAHKSAVYSLTVLKP